MAPISTETDALLTPRRQRTRERLIDAAYDVFAEEGVHASTVEQVCERAGFTRGAFYSNFTSKEELFAALMERQQDILLAALATKVDALGPHLEKVTTPLDEDGLVVESQRRPAADADDERRRYYRVTSLGKRVIAAEAERMASLAAAARAALA